MSVPVADQARHGAGAGPPTEGQRGPVRTVSDALDLQPAREAAARIVRDGTLPCLVFGVADGTGRREIVAVPGLSWHARSDSVFFIASVTKAIVATALMRYVDEERLDLHAPLVRHLPELRGDGRESISAWHVLTHTSGLPDIGLEDLRRERPSYARLVRRVMAGRPAWPPGSRYEYNSSAWLLLSETMARLSSMPFAQALAVRITRPLAMMDTTFDPRHARSRLVGMSGFGVRGRVTGEVLLRFLARATLPGGGMFSTVGDLLRLGSSLLDEGPGRGQPGMSPRLLTHRAVEMMSRPQLEGIPHIAADGTVTAVRQAIGWRNPAGEWPDRPSVLTHGGISGARLWVDREASLVFALLTNRWDAPDGPAAAILAHVYEAIGHA
jgi:CubicO group peptidase (beta-lactamase class C family)